MTGSVSRASRGARTEAPSPADLESLLRSGATSLGVSLVDSQIAALLDYVGLLAKWNAVYNLTAIRDPRQMVIQHILDSLAIVPQLMAHGPATLLDVGSGGGLPGIVVAIAMPACRVTTNDIVQKKTAFQQQVKGSLRLANLSVVTGRVETLREGIDVPGKFDAVVSRAFAEVADFVTLARHLVAPAGALWAMKGVRPDDEIARLPAGATVRQVIRLNVPSLEAERHLIEIAVESQ
jgi:16S rRNA (guanine527-N7)-methyltransferase